MNWFSSLRMCAARILRPSTITDEMDEELSTHVALRADDLERSGMPRAEAARRARIEFGARERLREECHEARGGTSVMSVGQDLRFAMRMIRSHGWFSTAVIVTLALGIGVNTMVFTIVNAALLRSVPVPAGSRLVALTSGAPGNGDNRLSYPDLLDYRAQARSFSALEGADQDGAVLAEPGIPPQAYHLARTTAGIFSMLHVQPFLGRDFLASDALRGSAPVVMLGYDVWQTRYAASPSVIGRQVRVNGSLATIIGVMPKGFMFPTTVEVWMPLTATPDVMKRDNRHSEASVCCGLAWKCPLPRRRLRASRATLLRSTLRPIKASLRG